MESEKIVTLSDLAIVKQRLESNTNFELEHAESYENKLEYSTLETADGSLPNEHQLSLFKQGNIKLWLVSYSLFLKSVEVTELDAADLKERK